MIDPKTIEEIKLGVDLVALIQSKGIALKKQGKNFLGLCPFHDDKNPSLSINPSKNLWQCFGCGQGGDVIRFVELFDKVDFPEAVNRLRHSAAEFPERKDLPENHRRTIKERKLLSRVVAYYQHTLTADPRGLDYLRQERGITDNQSLKDFGAGYVNGTLLEILPEDAGVIGSLKKLGILNAKGHEVFYNCVVFPLFGGDGSVENLYGRSIDSESAISHLYLPGPRRGIVNRQAVKRSSSILITESIIDALTLYDQGFKNVVPVYGANGLLDEHLAFFSRHIKEAYLVFDHDEAGQKAAASVATRLKEKEITVFTVTLPAKDANLFFKRHSAEAFEELLKDANPQALEQSAKVDLRSQTFFKASIQGFTVGYGERQYQIKGIQRGDTQLKATVKASKSLNGKHPFELSTIDLYSSRSRVWFAKLCSSLFEVPEELIKEDLGKILVLVENHRAPAEKPEAAKISEKDRQTAMAFLKNPEIFKEILADLETLGVIGEETNKLLSYLAAVSRKLDDPLSILIQSRSAAGKSTLQDAILSLVPPEDYVKYTRITDQALFYKEEDALINKILAIEEEVGMGGAAYSIRNIQSSKKITVATTGKDPGSGKMRTEEYTVNGPVAVMITTTSTELDGETASRFLFLTIDESNVMTEAIHKIQREAETLDGLIRKKKMENIINKHHAAQRLLKPLAVVNPFTKYLRYPTNSLRTRRDHKKYLGLIRTIAYLYQFQREVHKIDIDGEILEYVEVTLDDIDKANELANDVLGHSLDELSQPSRTLLSLIFEMVKKDSAAKKCCVEEIYFSRRMIREHSGWSDWQVRAYIKQLEEMEYLCARQGAKGKEYAYILNYNGNGEENGRFYLNLTSVEEIISRMHQDSEVLRGKKENYAVTSRLENIKITHCN